MIVTNEKELQGLKESGRIVAMVLKELMQMAEPGITTKELDETAGKLFTSYGASSAPISMYNFPGYTCISVNEEIAHGIPGPRILRAGDMVNIDVSAVYNGYYADTGASFLLPPDDRLGKKLLNCGQMALEKAIAAALAGRRLSAVGRAVENTAKRSGFHVIKNLCGHGVGHTLHDEPEMIENYYNPKDTRVIKNGMVLAIEPFVSEKEEYVVENKGDGWTLCTPKKTRAVQFEHTVVVTEGKPIIITLP